MIKRACADDGPFNDLDFRAMRRRCADRGRLILIPLVVEVAPLARCGLVPRLRFLCICGLRDTPISLHRSPRQPDLELMPAREKTVTTLMRTGRSTPLLQTGGPSHD
jgi:hypothetical protein